MHELLMWAGGIVISTGAAITGWVFKMVFDAIRRLEEHHEDLDKSLADHKLESSKTYATKSDVEKGFDKTDAKLDKILDKIERMTGNS